MKKLFRFALAALATAALFVSCEDELKPEEKPEEKDQKVELKGISLDKTTASVKVGETATLKVLYNPDNATEKPAATWASDTPAVATVDGGVVKGVAAGEAKITATVGTFTASATVTVTEDVIPSKYPLDLVDWDNLNKDYLVSLELPEGAAMTGLKSAKLYYDDKLYILAEISDEAIADGKVRMHVYFDVDKTGGLQQHWDKPVIDYMTEGKITNGGAYVSYSSSLYAWGGTAEEPWKWNDSGLAPTCVGGGKDNLYEMSMDYAGFADKMPVAFNIGLDVVNSNWATFGFLPSVAEGTPKLARIVKAGQTDPGEEEEDLWDYTPSAEYLAEDNLWKAAVGNEKYFAYMNIAANWSNAKYDNVEAAEFPFLSFDQSTYKLAFADQTFERWQNQFYIFPGDQDHFVGLQANHVYNLKITVSASAPLNAFFKFSQYVPDGPKHEGPAIWEPAGYPNNIVIANAYEQVVLEKEITGVTCDNILLLFDFGGNAANTNVYIKDVILVDKGAAKELVQKAEWLFSAEAASTDETCYGYTFSAGNPTFKDGKLDSFTAAFSKEPGDGGKYVKSNVSEGGLIQYFQIDKTEIDTDPDGKAARTVGGTGHPFVSGAWPGDYWLFTLGENDRPEYPAGTKLHIKFLTRLSGTGQKYWLLEYWDGAEWKPAADVQDGTVGEGDAVQNFKYNFEPTTKTSNSTVDVTWTLAAATKTPMFRYTCMANWQANGNGALDAPNGGTCRIAGASGTSPVFEVVTE